MPVQYRSQVATFEEFGAPCACGAENFERVIVERVLARPVVTDLVACVECRCVYYSPLPRAAPAAARSGPPMPSGTVTSEPGMLRTWGAIPPGHPPREQTPEELKRIKEAAARAGKSRKKSR